jgi:hypothetical protein
MMKKYQLLQDPQEMSNNICQIKVLTIFNQELVRIKIILLNRRDWNKIHQI